MSPIFKQQPPPAIEHLVLVSEAHAFSEAEVLERLESNSERGLSQAAAVARKNEFGPNELRQAPPDAWWKKFLGQFRELVVIILLVAAVISAVSGDWVEMGAILAIVLVNGILGYLQEERAERALEALRRLSTPTARVIRDGALVVVPARELVPGDLFELEAGDSVPADARLIDGYGLRVQEAALTGESVPVTKEAAGPLPADLALADRTNMVYTSTIVSAGKGRGVVTGTGMSTELGRIAGLLERQKPEPTPLQRRLAELGKILVFVCLAIVALIFVLDLVRGEDLSDVFLRAVSLAVAAVPEGLPAVVTLALALGLQRMVARNVLVRKLPSVETLGSVTVICSDKTGTLTRNEMTARVFVTGGVWYRLSGSGYAPTGEFVRVSRSTGESESPVNPQEVPDLRQALLVGLRCNNARLSQSTDGSGAWQIVGDPTEGALVTAALKGGLPIDDPSERRTFEIPFDSARKTMSVVYSGDSASKTLYTKGAPEVVLSLCTREMLDGKAVELTGARRQALVAANGELAAQALRVLALAWRPAVAMNGGEISETEMTFAGLVGMIDPPRDEVRPAIQRCRAAGITPVMITGDHPQTAAAIARELGLASDSAQTVEGRMLDSFTDEQLKERVERFAVYARVAPEHKLRVVDAWKSRGEIVAMTGDGVNDAPAVKLADIGIAMGITGTDVTKAASDMVLTDDNFASIVNAVEEGRGIFDNIQKFVHYLLSCNAGEVLLMLFAAVCGWPAPLTAIQILWINLVTDGLPALALGMEPPEPDIMRRPPRPPHEPVINISRGLLIVAHGMLVAAAAAVGFWLVTSDGHDPQETLDRGRTVAFAVMSYAQLVFSFGCRSHSRTLPQLGLFTNPHLLAAIAISGLLQLAALSLPFAQAVFHSVPLAAREWGLAFFLALVPVTVIETAKLINAAVGKDSAAGRAAGDAGVP